MVLEHIKIMMKRMNILRIALTGFVAVSFGACHTVEIPKIEVAEIPEFSSDGERVPSDIPRVNDAPAAPTNLRSDQQWDKDARALEKLRESPLDVEMEAGPTSAEGQAYFDKLKAKAQAYKKDDPATGPVQGFPEYKERR